jgi:hypothetical protein
MPTAESAPSTAFPAIRRLGTPLGTSGHVPGQFRAQIRATASPAPSLAVDNALISLPVKLGGLGILSFKTCAPLAFTAASEASDSLLASLLDQDIDTTNRSVLSQGERCQEAFLSSKKSLLESLDPQSAKSVIEASYLLGRKWVSVIPFSPALRLNDFEVSAALHARTLLPGGATHCRHCGARNQLGHDEICVRRAPWTVARHEQAKRAIGTALATVDGLQVHLEPLITGTQRRNDIRITGSAASGLSSEEMDTTIVSLAFQDSQTATLQLTTPDDDSAAQRTSKLVAKHLNAVATEKRRWHPPSDRPFRPFVLFLGGMMKTEAKHALKIWKSIMTGGVYSLLVRRLSLGLLRARARCFEP